MKACIYCRHCQYSEARNWSEYTYESAYFYCDKGHFNYEDGEDIGEARLYLVCQSCNDYDLTEEIKKMIALKEPEQ